MTDTPAIEVRIWGTRGTVPMAGPDMLEFGGHSCCVEARAGGRVMVFDAGSGIIPLGQALAEEGVSEIELFFSHAHYDHILGLPFFRPAFSEETKLCIWAGHMLEDYTPEQMVAGLFRAPYYPISKDVMRAQIDYQKFSPGDVLNPVAGVSLQTGTLPHPNGAVGYRLETPEAAFAYITDFEHDGGSGDETVLRLARDADLVLIDATYTPEEYPRFAGFGHSTWADCGALCAKAGAKRWGMFHHKHLRTDAEQRAIEKTAQAEFPNAFATREGQRFALPEA